MSDATRLTKKDFALLEKIFESEITGTLPFQSRSKEYKRLEEEGLVQHVTQRLRGRFPVDVHGWVLTLRGHCLYCANCPEIPDDESGAPCREGLEV